MNSAAIKFWSMAMVVPDWKINILGKQKTTASPRWQVKVLAPEEEKKRETKTTINLCSGHH